MITNGRLDRTAASGQQAGLLEEVRSFVGHARQLASLQRRLFVKDLDESRARLVRSIVILLIGTGLLFGAVPVCMVACGVLLAEWTQLSPGWCLLIVSGAALVLSGGMVAIGMNRMRWSLNVFRRSRIELAKNLDSLFGEKAAAN